MTRAFIYTRKSTEHSQENSHDTQRIECETYAILQGLVVDQVFADTCSGGLPPYKRPAFSEMLDQLHEGDVVITWKRDRLGRSVIENAITERLLRKAGVQLVSLNAAQGDEPEAIMMRTLLDAFSEYEKAMIGRRTRAALRMKKERGEVIGNVPLGFEATQEGMVEPNPHERQKVEWVRRYRAEGMTYSALQDLCEQEGITARSGQTPSQQTLANWCSDVQLIKPVKRKKTASSREKQKTKRSINETHPQLIYMILDLREKGLSSRKIAEVLTERGYTTAKGGAFQKTQVLRILRRIEDDTDGGATEGG